MLKYYSKNTLQVNIFDVSQENEDDALITTLNAEALVKSATWLKDDKIGIVFDHEEAIVWKIEDSQPYKTFNREDFTVAIKRKITPWTYIAGKNNLLFMKLNR